MRILKFEGATMRDAIAKVKAELGDQAVIISTRQVRRGLLGAAIEISAAVDDGDEGAGPHTGGPIRASAAANGKGADAEQLIAPLRNEMRSLRAMVRSSDHGRGTAELRAELVELRKLISQFGTAPETAPSAPQAPRTPSAAYAAPRRARTQTAQRAETSHLTKASTGRVLVLVGPTGAGKTTTLAKLAARAALIENKRVRLITLDNYRVGGVDQIRTFADLIGVPLAVAEGAADLASLLSDDEAESFDLTLVDTAGKSPRDTSSIVDLAAELPNLPPLEIHVVVPAAASASAIDELVARYRPLGPSRLLITKLDEVELPTELATAPMRTGLPITWVTTGQAVPEDIEEPTQARLLELATRGLASTSNHRAA